MDPEKTADQNQHFFSNSACKFMPISELLMFDWIKIGEGRTHKFPSMIRVYLICSIK